MNDKYFNVFIIPTIGRPELSRAIESVISQNGNTDHLIVVIFDAEPISKVIKNDHVVYLKTDKHVWGAGARQFGMDWCISNKLNFEYFSFLDDDDYITPNFTKVLKDHSDWDLVIHSMKFPFGVRPIQSGTSPFARGYCGSGFSIKRKSVISKSLKWKPEAAADYWYMNRASKLGIKHYKTGIVTYHVPIVGRTGIHTKRKFGPRDNWKR